MKFARIIERVAVDVIEGVAAELFHPDVAVDFVEVPEDVIVGSQLVDGVWIDPAPEAPAPEPVDLGQMAIIDFLRLFHGEELDRFNECEVQCNALTPADYLAAREGDLAKMALVGFKRFLTFYYALRAGLIELRHTETIQGLSLLVPLGVLTEERLQTVLAGDPPE